MRHLIYALLFVAGAAFAGPDDPSKFDDSALPAQKTVYHFNLEKPEDFQQGLAYMTNHLNALKAFGGTDSQSSLVAVAIGNELHMLSRLNRAAYPDIYEKLKALADRGVVFRACRNAATFRGYKPQDFYDVVTVVPAGVTDLAKWQAQGYAYISGDAVKRSKRSEFREKHPEILD